MIGIAEKETLVFVYGTLKRGHPNAHYLDGQIFVGEANTAPLYRMVDCGGYPGMYRAKTDGISVKGEIWKVDVATLKRLNQLEDVDYGLYTFEPVDLLGSYAKSHTPIFAYFYALPTAHLRDVGDCWEF